MGAAGAGFLGRSPRRERHDSVSATPLPPWSSSPSWCSAPLGSPCFPCAASKWTRSNYGRGPFVRHAIFLWVLLAGEIYTTFTFLGIAGLSYSQGAPAYYVMAYGVCAYLIGYFLAPAIWRVAKDRQSAHLPRLFRNTL